MFSNGTSHFIDPSINISHNCNEWEYSLYNNYNDIILINMSR